MLSLLIKHTWHTTNQCLNLLLVGAAMQTSLNWNWSSYCRHPLSTLRCVFCPVQSKSLHRDSDSTNLFLTASWHHGTTVVEFTPLPMSRVLRSSETHKSPFQNYALKPKNDRKWKACNPQVASLKQNNIRMIPSMPRPPSIARHARWFLHLKRASTLWKQ